jgi:hypothetical protein
MSTEPFCRRAFAMACLCVAWALPASAEGSLPLAEVLEAVRSEPQLVSQIEVELRKRDLKVPEIVCTAARHGNQWRFLGGGRAAPYECRIGDRTVVIDAERIYFDGNGRKLGQLGQAPDNVLFNRAKFFREGKFRWTWSP